MFHFIIILKLLYLQGSELNRNVPTALFGGAAIFIAISVLHGPETFRKKLPETFEEAINL